MDAEKSMSPYIINPITILDIYDTKQNKVAKENTAVIFAKAYFLLPFEVALVSDSI